MASRAPAVREPDARLAARWRALGRLLPKDVRERIYEPAFSDLLHDWLTRTDRGRGSLHFGVQAIGTVIGCLPIAVPRLFFRGGAPTRFAWVTLVSLAALLVVFLLTQQPVQTEPMYN